MLTSSIFIFWWEGGIPPASPPPPVTRYDIIWPDADGAGNADGIDWPNLTGPIDYPDLIP